MRRHGGDIGERPRCGAAGVVLALLALLFVGVRLLTAWLLRDEVNGDLAIVQMMVRDMTTGGVIPAFFYGQAYMGSLEPIVNAAFHLLFGRTAFGTELGTAFFLVLMAVAVVRMARRAGGVASSARGEVGELVDLPADEKKEKDDGEKIRRAEARRGTGDARENGEDGKDGQKVARRLENREVRAQEAAEENHQKGEAEGDLHLRAGWLRPFVGVDAPGQRGEDAQGEKGEEKEGRGNRERQGAGSVGRVYAEKHGQAFGNQEMEVARGDGRLGDEAPRHLERLPAVARVPHPEGRGAGGEA